MNFKKETQDNNKFKIIFYPHQTTNYGDLYDKDFFYSDDQNSLFNKYKLLHIEFEKKKHF